MAKTDDWMPLIIARWRRGTAFMTPAARGVYLDLLLVCWEQGCLPTADEVLQPLARCTEKVWKQVRDAVRAKFQERDGFLHHDVVDAEKQKANEIYERKSAAGKAGGQASGKQRAKQSRSRNEADVQAEPQAKTNTTYLEHSPDGEKSSNEDLGKSKRATAIPPTWQPTLKDQSHAAAKGLDAQTITAVGEQFRDHHTAKGTLSKDWGASWRTWIGNHISYHGTGRWPSARPDRNASRTASPTAARDSILAKAGVRREGGVDELSADARPPHGIDLSQAGSGVLIDADDWREVPGPSDGNEGDDTAQPGDHSGHRSADGGVSQAADGLPGGRGELRADDAAGLQPVVACMGGAEGAFGNAHVPQADDDDGLDIPACMRRTA